MEEVQVKKQKHQLYEPIHPAKDEWPVMQMARDRKNFIEEVYEETTQRIFSSRKNIQSLIEELELTRFKEYRRIKDSPWKVDPDDELQFWQDVKSRLVEIEKDTDKQHQENLVEDCLRDIVKRYANEIAGNFKPSHFRLARRLVTFWFNRLLNAAKLKRLGSFMSNEYSMRDQINIIGEVDHLRKLAKLGTVVMVPTHFSNLDSVTLGWAINELGLPPFIYGAGLNLFNIDIFAYFMNSLGAYKVDRRKKNMIYLETLKTYSSVALRKGCHSLFFPGGTRSRSGKIETRLKLGLLGTAIEAQRVNYERGGTDRSNKLFVFPVVINYNFVLEAPALISNFLEQQGQERYYVENDEFSKSHKILKFLHKFFTKGSSISLSIGKGMDLFGNVVDEEGRSVDKNGTHINTRDYFISGGKITKDLQREEVYTRLLSEKIVAEYHRINQVFASHLAPFVAFELIQRKHLKLDFFSLLRLPADEIEVDYNEFKEVFNRLRERILKLKTKGKIDVAEHMYGDSEEVINLGISNVGMYHSKRPLIFLKNGNIGTQDLNTLYFYHNRMDGYELDKLI